MGDVLECRTSHLEGHPFWEGGCLVCCSPDDHPFVHFSKSSITPSIHSSIYHFLQTGAKCLVRIQSRPPTCRDDLCHFFCLILFLGIYSMYCTWCGLECPLHSWCYRLTSPARCSTQSLSACAFFAWPSPVFLQKEGKGDTNFS